MTSSTQPAAGSPAAGRHTSAGAAHRTVTKAAALSALGGVLFGYDTGVIGGVLPNIADEFSLKTPFMKGLVVAVLLAGAAVGALVAGRLADLLGRRKLVLVTSATFVIGIAVASLAPALSILLIGRFVIGMGVGAASFGVPLYIGELAPPSRRGGLVSFNQLCITGGILVSQLVAYALAGHGDWRISTGLAVVPAIILGVGVLGEPESPAWLLRQGREDDARRVFDRIRGEDDDVDAEIDEIREVAQQEQKASPSELLGPKVRPALVVGVVLAVIQQITGVNTVIYFAPTVLEQAGLGSQAALLAFVVVGLTNVVLTIVAIRLLDRVGRRPLLLFGTAGMVVGLGVLGLLFLGGIHGTTEAVLATASLCFYIGAFAIGLGPVFWLLVSELFPLRVRGQGASVATMANWLANLVVAVSYLSIISAIGGSATFWGYAAISVASLLYMVRAVPETKGRSLSEIERDLRGTGGSSGTSPRAGHAVA